MSFDALLGFAPLLIFMAVAVCMSIVIRRHTEHSGKGFLSEYFIGNRSLGGFVLAMTTVATYGSVSSFVGGPGQAWDYGFGWVYMATCQVTALFLLYGILGKRMALIARKINAVTIVDVIRARFQSNAVATLSALVIVVFFIATMVAQFVGGARLFEAVTGYSYVAGLLLFGILAIVFTTIGGFRGVAFTDALCGIVMLIGLVILAGGIITAGGGWENIMVAIETNHPEMMEPGAGGDMPWTLYFTQWLLVGVFTFCLPQSVVRTMSYDTTKAVHRAMLIGTIVLGFMMIAATTLGVISAGILPGSLEDYGNSVDNIIPRAIVASLPPVLGGIAIIGPIAASISTVSSLLIVASSSIIKDIYITWRTDHGHEVAERPIAWGSQIITLVIGVIVLVLSIVPPDVIWRINMFAFGGLETAFCWVLVFGLFWKRANKYGAMLSMAGGTLAYCISMALGFTAFGMHQITIGISVSFILMIIGSLATKAPDVKAFAAFFPEKEKA